MLRSSPRRFFRSLLKSSPPWPEGKTQKSRLKYPGPPQSVTHLLAKIEDPKTINGTWGPSYLICAAAPSGTVVLQGLSITEPALACGCLLSSTSDSHRFYPLQPPGINIYARLLETCLKKASGLNYGPNADHFHPPCNLCLPCVGALDHTFWWGDKGCLPLTGVIPSWPLWCPALRAPVKGQATRR